MKLIVEIDGGQHGEQVVCDSTRSNVLSSMGYQVIRFWNNEVINDVDGVLEAIRLAMQSPSPQPSPRKRGEGDDV